jgi:signal transduction histidine kinase
MLDDVKDEENKKNLELMISESERLSDLVHEFLELSKLESGKITLSKTEVNIKDIIEKEINKLSVRIEDKKINLETKYNGNQVILADKKQITKVIENILTNAIKFCKNDNFIKIKTYTKDEYFCYEVFNTGDNIKDDDIENIFNSYYKDKSTRNKEGTGLGLTIVKAIVDLHDGKCEVKNTKNGVKFIIKLKK